MHVLVIPSWYPTADAPTQGIYFREQVQMLQRDGLRVGVVYPEQRSLRRISLARLRDHHFQRSQQHEAGVPTVRFHGWNVWWRHPAGIRFRIREAGRLAKRYVDQHGVPDLIHAHSARWAGAAAACIGQALDIPYVLTEHFSGLLRDDVFPSRLPFVRDGFRNAAATAAVSTALRDALVTGGFVRETDIDVHPNPVDPAVFAPPAAPPPAHPFRFLTVTRLDGRKGTATLLRAFARAFPDAASVHLDVVGGGPKRGELHALCCDLGLSARVSFRGVLQRDALRRVYQTAHAFVLASRRETFGVVLIEALATGVPVVSTRCGGPEDIVTPDVGHLVPVGDVDALADALQALHRHRPTYDTARIRREAVERFGPEPFCRRTRSFYRRACRSGASLAS